MNSSSSKSAIGSVPGNHTLHLAAFPAEKWQGLLHDSGFKIHRRFSGYKLDPFIPGRDTCLFIEAEPC